MKKPLLLAWVSWLLGPVVFVYCAARNDGEPNCSLAALAVAGHGAAVVITIVMMGLPVRHRPFPDFWFVISYWVVLAGLFISMGMGSFDIGRVCLFATMWWVVLIPLAGVVRLVVALMRTARAGKVSSH